MSRNDGALYTGTKSNILSSPRQQQVLEKQAVARQKRLDTTHKLKPAAEPILALIDKHKKQAMFVKNVTGGEVLSDQRAGELLRSQQAIYDFLVQFEGEIRIALKEDV